MPLYSSVSWHKRSASPPMLCYFNAFLLVLLLVVVVPNVGDDSCDATTTDTATVEENCAPSNNVDNQNDESNTLPTWWNYNIDQLFEDHFDCGEIIYGYEQSDDDQVDSEDDSDDEFDSEDESSDDEDDSENDARKNKKDNAKISKHKDVVSENQLQNLRHQWAVIREKYVKEINLVPIDIHSIESDSTSKKDIGKHRNGAAIINNYGKSAMVVPNRIGDAGPGKGRGVFATEPIAKGTLVVDLVNGSTGIFKDGHSWRKFAVSLPRETACNFIEWSWVQTIPREDERDDDIRNGLTIFVAFDESNLLNSADWDDMEENVSCGIPLEDGGRGPCRFHYYAARDIAAGEELLINYGEFEDLDQQGWTDIGL